MVLKRKRLLSKISDNKSAAKCHQDCERQVLMEGWKMLPPELWLFLLQTLHVPIFLGGLGSPSLLHTCTGTLWSPCLTQALGLSWEPWKRCRWLRWVWWQTEAAPSPTAARCEPTCSHQVTEVKEPPKPQPRVGLIGISPLQHSWLSSL